MGVAGLKAKFSTGGCGMIFEGKGGRADQVRRTVSDEFDAVAFSPVEARIDRKDRLEKFHRDCEHKEPMNAYLGDVIGLDIKKD